VSSEEGKGSTFRVVLPAETPPHSEVRAARETGEAGLERRRKVRETR